MVCKNCGHELHDGDIFCENCGHKVDEEVNINEHTEENSQFPQKEQIADIEEKNDESAESASLDETSDGYFNPYDETTVENDAQQYNEPYAVQDDNSQNDYQFSTTPANNNVKTISINKKALITVCVLIAVLAIGTFGGFRIYNARPITVYMGDYVSSEIYTDDKIEEFYADSGQYDYDEGDYGEGDYEDSETVEFSTAKIGAGLCISGYSDYAYCSSPLYETVDWDRVVEDVNNQLQKKKKVNGRKLDIYDFVKSYEPFNFSIDIEENISNGDVLTVSTDEYSYTFGGITVDFMGFSEEYNVEGLQVVKAFDPFDYAGIVVYNPVNGGASVKISVKSDLKEKIESAPEFVVAYYDDKTISISKDNSIIAKISFYFDDDSASKDDLRNGDTVTMYYSLDNDNLTEDYSLYIARESEEHEISNLGEYATTSTKFTNEQINDFKKYSLKQLKAYLDEDESKTLKYSSAYLADRKDKSTYGKSNVLCIVYSYKYEWFEETETKYATVQFDNIIIDTDGSIPFNPESYYYDKSFGGDEADGYVNSNFSSYYNITKVS